MPLHTVRDWLAHSNIAQTSTYLAGTTRTQHDAMRAFEQRRSEAEPAAGAGNPELLEGAAN